MCLKANACLGAVCECTEDARAVSVCGMQHFYTSMVEWAREFECPIYLPEADYAWVMRNDGHLCFFPGLRLQVSPWSW